MYYSKIVGTGSYLPKKILTNSELEKLVDTSDEWIIERTGISERRIAADEESAATLAHNASMQAIAAANLVPEDIDMIVVATCTSDRFFPSTACLLQEHLQIERNIPAFDVTAACSGFVYAMTVADQFLKTSDTIRNILVVGTEVLSRGLDWKDRNTCILFGDGAGAVVLQQSKEPGILSAELFAQGKHKDILSLPNLTTAAKSDRDRLSQYLVMNGREVFRLATTFVAKAMQDSLIKNKINLSEVDWIIPHQANARIMQAIAKVLDISMDKFVSTINKHGNTSAASIPLALDEYVRAGKIKTGQLLMLEGFGGGMTWGSVLLRF